MWRNWNHERWRTRDRLLEYDFNLVPPHPHSAGLPFIYPWEDIQISQLKAQFMQIAQDYGYTGTEDELWQKFFDGILHHGTIDTFPVPGVDFDLYLDEETNILYYFRNADAPVNQSIIDSIGAVIVGTTDTNTYIYIPIRAVPLENLIYNCGDAAEYIG